MIIKKIKEPIDIEYQYIRSKIETDDCVIIVEKKIWNTICNLILDYYEDIEAVWYEINYLNEWDILEIIHASEIVDCPTSKWFYIVRKK